jgi:hypothetical protein
MAHMTVAKREKSSQSGRIHFAALRDDNRTFSEIICRTQENLLIKNSFLGVKLYKNRRFVSCPVKENI